MFVKKMHDFSVTFATLNCLEYTKQCVDSLLSCGVEAAIVHDKLNRRTPEFLQQSVLVHHFERQTFLVCRGTKHLAQRESEIE